MPDSPGDSDSNASEDLGPLLRLPSMAPYNEGREPTEYERVVEQEYLQHFNASKDEIPYETVEHTEFTDNAGRTGLSLYYGVCLLSQHPPVPKWSWQVYVTNGLKLGTNAAERAECLAFCKKIYEAMGMSEEYHRSWNGVPRFRFDFHFLPDASGITPCMAHYRAEKQYCNATSGTRAIPSYEAPSVGKSINCLTIVDSKDPKKSGVIFLSFDEQGVEAPLDDRWNDERYRMSLDSEGTYGKAWVGDKLHHITMMGDLWIVWDKQYWKDQKSVEAEWRRGMRTHDRPNYPVHANGTYADGTTEDAVRG